MMKVRTRKLLSLLLTLAMVVGMFVLPASAKENPTGVFTINFTDYSSDAGKQPAAKTEDNYFTLVWKANSSNDSISAQNATYGSQGDTDYLSGTHSFRTNGASKITKAEADGTVDPSKSERLIGFTTTNADATVKVWIYDSNGSRSVILNDNTGTSVKVDNVEQKFTTVKSNKASVATFTAGKAGKYWLSTDNGLRIHQVQVTDKAAVAGAGESTVSFVIPDGITVDDVKVGGTAKKLASTGETKSLFATAGATATFKLVADKGYTVSKVMAGETELTATNEVYTVTMPAEGATTTVTITASADLNPATKVELDATTAELKANGTKNLTATLTAQTEGKDCTDTVEWTSSNPDVATVDATGKVTAKAIGQTTITAKANESVSATCKVSVVGADQTGTTYVMESKKMAAATAEQLADVDSIKYDNYFTVYTKNKIDNSNKTWSSDSYESGRRVNFNAGAAVDTESVKFTTSKAATVKVWWVANKDNYNMTMLGSTGTAVTGAPSTEASKGNSTYISTFEAPAAGTYYVGGDGVGNYVFKIEVTEKAAEQPKDMTVTAENVSAVYDGKSHGITVKVTDPADAKVTYSDAADGTFSETAITITNVSDSPKTVYYKAEKAGYNTATGSATITITKAKVTLGLDMPSGVAQATVKGQDNQVEFTLSGLPEGAKASLSCPKTIADLPAEATNGKITVTVPDKTEDYAVTATYAGDANHTGDNITRAFHTREFGAKPRVYVLTVDSAVITINGQEVASGTEVEVGTEVKVTANAAAEGKEFDKWVITGPLADRFDEQAKVSSVTFNMPAGATSFTATYKDKVAETVAVTGVSLNTNTLELIAGEDATLIASVQPGNATDKTVTWASDKPAVATVDANGKVTAVADGTAKITVTTTDGAKTATCDVTVTASSEPTPTTETFDATTLTAAENKEPMADGEVTGFFKNTGSITKRTGEDGKVTAIELAKNAGGAIEFTLTAPGTVKVDFASTGTSNTSLCGIQDASNATVAEDTGLTSATNITATTFTYTDLPAGTYRVVATDSSRGARVMKIIVSTISGGTVPVTGVSLDKTTVSIDVGGTETLDATIAPTNATNKKLTWSTSDPAVATVADGVVTAVKAGTATITVTTANGKTASCTVKVTESSGGSSSSGGGSSSNVPSTSGGTTVKNEDGSKTTTKTNKATGTVTETTTWPNGDKQVVVTEKDGTVTETITKKDGSKTETVTKPDGSTTTAVTDTKGIKTETAVTASGETSAKVTLPNRVDKAVVTIPVKDATDGTVAVIVDAKGNETVIKTAVADETGLKLLVTGNVSVKIKDNAKKFQDIDDGYWAKGAVDFASSREIFKGTTEVTFSPMDLVDRGMMATVLFRLADAKAEGENSFFDVPDGNWYTDAVTWANRSGVVTGYADGTFGPADAVTREQMATMLFRYAKVMGMDVTVKGDVSKFGDVNDVSSWASEAMTWCVGVGLINGVADPATGVTLSPAKTASRAEVATIMQRMVKLMMQ